MKKGLILCALCLLLSGCNDKKLECVKKDNYWDDIKVEDSYEIKFSGDDIKQLDYKKELKVSGDLINNKEDVRRSYAADFERIESSNLIVNSEIDENDIEIEVEAEYKKLTTKEKDVFKDIDGKLNKEKLKKDLEKKGYICK